MSNRYRDVKNVSVFGNAWLGVQEVNTPLESDVFEFSADDSIDIQRTDITNLSVSIAITVQDPQHKRDLKNPRFGVSEIDSVDFGTDTINDADHCLADGRIIQFWNVGGALPAPLAAGTDYYVVNSVAGVSFQVSLTEGGAAIDLTSAGTGTNYYGLPLGIAMSAGITASADEIVDSAEDDKWRTYVSVTRRKLEAECEIKDIEQGYLSNYLALGYKGTFEFESLPGRSCSGFGDPNAYERFSLKNMIITGISPTMRHGELASATINMQGYGDPNGNGAQFENTTSDATPTGFEVHPGDTGNIVFVAPAALAGGQQKQVTISNCVLIDEEISAQHGERLERTFNFRAYSADGQTSPVSIIDFP